MKVLIADDDRVLTQLLGARLKARGWEVDVAHDALQAWTSALRHQPSVIVLDVNMPGGSGLQVLQRLHSSTKTEGIPVVVVSSTHTAETEKKVAELGAAAFMPKPLEIQVLHDTLLRLANP
jgi:two-component system KDP operon response regulator KdpE